MYAYGKVKKNFGLALSGLASKILAVSQLFSHFSSICFKNVMKLSRLGRGVLKVLFSRTENVIPHIRHRLDIVQTKIKRLLSSNQPFCLIGLK